MSTPSLPRYSDRAFPSYHHRPGRTHHPATHPQGHSFGHAERPLSPQELRDWPASESFRFGIDLFNHAYFWEAHEAWEVIWKALPEGPERRLVRGLIQLAAALLKMEVGEAEGARRLVERAKGNLAADLDARRFSVGFDVSALMIAVEQQTIAPVAALTIELKTASAGFQTPVKKP